MMKTCLSEKMTIAKISTAGYAQQNHLWGLLYLNPDR